jgi:hypothetical protein
MAVTKSNEISQNETLLNPFLASVAFNLFKIFAFSSNANPGAIFQFGNDSTILVILYIKYTTVGPLGERKRAAALAAALDSLILAL